MKTGVVVGILVLIGAMFAIIFLEDEKKGAPAPSNTKPRPTKKTQAPIAQDEEKIPQKIDPPTPVPSRASEEPPLPTKSVTNKRKTREQLEKERDVRRRKIQARLPKGPQYFKELCASSDPEKLAEAWEAYIKGTPNQKQMIELSSVDNQELKRKIAERVRADLATGKTELQRPGILSAINVKAFDEKTKVTVRAFIQSNVPEVASTAIAFAVHTKDEEVFDVIIDTLTASKSSRVKMVAFLYLSATGRGKTTRFEHLLQDGLTNEDHDVRGAALKCTAHLIEAMKNSGVYNLVKNIAESDPYTKGNGTFPFRRQAALGLKRFADRQELERRK
ncbi:hypothetical protein ACFL4W_00080 [Planctomycetota bacterium]